MGKKLSLLGNALKGNMKVCELALTNVCTAKCKFCSIWSQKPKVIVDLEKTKKAITHMAQLGTRFITLTGGEPLTHPHFEEIIDHCTKNNVITAILNADARLLTKDRLDALKRSKTDVACISIDHHSDKIASESRSIPGIMKHIEKAVVELKKRKITVWALTLISNYNHKSLRQLFQKCTDIGFDTISVNYPIFSKSPVYTLGGEAIELSREELIRALEEVMELRKEFKIVNPIHSIKNIIQYLRNEPPKFPCLAGYRTLFVDWNFKVYPCMYLPDTMGDVLELKDSHFKKINCNKCNMSWYRDFSIYFQGIKSIRPLVSALPGVMGNWT